jgi:hypothetical protein
MWRLTAAPLEKLALAPAQQLVASVPHNWAIDGFESCVIMADTHFWLLCLLICPQ